MANGCLRLCAAALLALAGAQTVAAQEQGAGVEHGSLRGPDKEPGNPVAEYLKGHV